MKLQIDAPWGKDLSKNHNRCGPEGKWNYKSHVAAWIDRVGWEFKGAIMELRRSIGLQWEIKPPLLVSVSFRFPNARTRDDHNYYEVICDALKGVTAIDDDQIRISTASIEINGVDPGFSIVIEDSS